MRSEVNPFLKVADIQDPHSISLFISELEKDWESAVRCLRNEITDVVSTSPYIAIILGFLDSRGMG